jgi:NADH pyrophosphatase NudC (nudix superfamily)
VKSLKASIYKICYPAAKIYWFITRPTTQGVRCLITNEDKVLLIKHTYGSILKTTVGGGVKKGETLEQAVIREVKEETGINLNDVMMVGVVMHKEEFKNDTINVFIAETETTDLILDRSEILEADWYPLSNLPNDTSPLFNQFLDLARPYLQDKFVH